MEQSTSKSKEHLVLLICGIICAAVAIVLSWQGNPANMAICVACFIRDSAGALHLHGAEAVQYFRPEIVGMVLGAFLMARFRKEFKPQAGSSPFTRFLLSFMMMIGALIFLGCPLRMILRMSAGDLNAWVALLGYGAGIASGVFFLRKGFSLGETRPTSTFEGVALPVILVALLVLGLTTTLFAVSAKGPGALHAPVVISLVGGLAFGAVAQRTRLCFSGGLRDPFLIKDWSRFSVIGCIFVGMLIFNLASGHFKLSFAEQPIAHTEALWNILGMYVVGFAATLLGGCPLRQLTRAGSGSGDSAVTFAGLLVGAAFAHNFGLASSGTGTTPAGQIATLICIAALFVIAFLGLRKSHS